MESEHEIERMELSKEQAQETIDLAKSLAILKNNDHFKKIFLNKYLDQYAVRLVLAKASPGMQDEKQQLHIATQLNGIGQMNQYMLYIEQEGRIASEAMADYEEELASMREEG